MTRFYNAGSYIYYIGWIDSAESLADGCGLGDGSALSFCFGGIKRSTNQNIEPTNGTTDNIASQGLSPAFCNLRINTIIETTTNIIPQIIRNGSQYIPTWWVLVASINRPNPIVNVTNKMLQIKKLSLLILSVNGFIFVMIAVSEIKSASLKVLMVGRGERT
jgi:hypothetical protein